MAWDVDSQKLVAKVIATVESNLHYDAINYNDPITVGAFQWYGTRAAGILTRIRTENAASWTGVVGNVTADLIAHPSTDSWWTGRYLTRAEGESLKPVLQANQPIQNNQAIADFEAYKSTYVRQGGDAEGNTDAMLFFMCMYHQNPVNSLAVLRSAGVNAGLDRLLAVCLNNVKFSQFKTRYNTAATIIRSHDSSGIDLGGEIGTVTPTPDGGDAPVDGAVPRVFTDMSYIKRVGSNMHIIYNDGHQIICAPYGNDTWPIPGDYTQSEPVPDNTGVPVDPTYTGNNAGAKALAWMMANQGKWDYSQGPGRDNPDVSGYTDCSACVRLAYLKTGGPDIGGNTTAQYQYGSLLTTNRETIRAGTGLMPGDLIFYRNFVDPSHPYNHVEMYTGDAERRTIGQAPSKAPGPALSPMDTYLNYGGMAVMARRPVTSRRIAVLYSRQPGNLYTGGSNENIQMFAFATQVANLLAAQSGWTVLIPPNTDADGVAGLNYNDNVKWVQARHAESPIAEVWSFHSNAAGDATILFGNGAASLAAATKYRNALNADNFMPFGDTWDLNTKKVSEMLAIPTAESVLFEMHRHDNATSAEWLRVNIANGTLAANTVRVLLDANGL